MLRERTLAHPILLRDRVTATEAINGTPCRIVLEQDMFGQYRELLIEPVSGSAGWRPADDACVPAVPPARPGRPAASTGGIM